MHTHAHSHRDQQKRIESTEINPGTYSQYSTKEARIYNGEKTVSSVSGARKVGQPHEYQ